MGYEIEQEDITRKCVEMISETVKESNHYGAVGTVLVVVGKERVIAYNDNEADTQCESRYNRNANAPNANIALYVNNNMVYPTEQTIAINIQASKDLKVFRGCANSQKEFMNKTYGNHQVATTYIIILLVISTILFKHRSVNGMHALCGIENVLNIADSMDDAPLVNESAYEVNENNNEIERSETVNKVAVTYHIYRGVVEVVIQFYPRILGHLFDNNNVIAVLCHGLQKGENNTADENNHTLVDERLNQNSQNRNINTGDIIYDANKRGKVSGDYGTMFYMNTLTGLRDGITLACVVEPELQLFVDANK